MSVAASLPPTARKSLAIEVLAKTEPISHLAAQHQVSRKFLYQQGQKANEALDASFSPTTDEPKMLFYLPITKTWLWPKYRTKNGERARSQLNFVLG
jgi:hypothetical protein